jgi:hypothetical protein
MESAHIAAAAAELEHEKICKQIEKSRKRLVIGDK